MKSLCELDLTVSTTYLLLTAGIETQEQLMNVDLFELACRIHKFTWYTVHAMIEVNDYRCNNAEFLG